MPYVIQLADKPDHAKLRAEVRAVHLDYLDAHKDELLAAGALVEDDGSGGSGSLYVVATDDRKEAERFLAGDPFYKAGLFGKVTITRWRKAFFDKCCRATWLVGSCSGWTMATTSLQERRAAA